MGYYRNSIAPHAHSNVSTDGGALSDTNTILTSGSLGSIIYLWGLLGRD